MKKVLVVDIGGTNVKAMISREERRKFASGGALAPRQLHVMLDGKLDDWKYDVVSVGFPAPVRNGRILTDPKNLGRGWTRFNFEKAFGKPVRVVNDAAMQALGSYRGGRMLFIGLGTGFGSALVWNGTVLPLELSELPYLNEGTIEDHVGKAGFKQIGRKTWENEVDRILVHLQRALWSITSYSAEATPSCSSICLLEWNWATTATLILAASESGKIIHERAARGGRFCRCKGAQDSEVAEKKDD